MIRLLAILLVLLPLAAMAAPAPRMFSTLADALNSTPQSYAVNGKAEVQVNGRVDPGDWGAPRIGRGIMGEAGVTNLAYRFDFTNGWGQLVFGDDFPVNVRHFGAVDDPLDESTDSTSAIQAAIQYAGDRAAVYFPQGRYVVTEPLSFTDRLHAYGDGHGSMISVMHSGAGWQNPTPSTRLYEILLRDFAINTAGGARPLAAITMTNVSYFRIENVFIHAFDGKGFQHGVKSWGDSPSGGSWSSSIVGCTIYAYAGTNGPAYAIYGSGGPAWGYGPNSWRVLDNYLNVQPDSVFGGGGTNHGTAVVYIENVNGPILSGNIFEGSYTNAVIFTNASAFTISENRFEHAYGSGGTNFVAIRLESVTNATVVGNMFQGLGDKSSVLRPGKAQATILDPSWGGAHTINGNLLIGGSWDVDNRDYLPLVSDWALVESALASNRLAVGVRNMDGTQNARAVMYLNAMPTPADSHAGIFAASSLASLPFYFIGAETNLSITGLGTAIRGLPLSGAELTVFGDIAGGLAPSLWTASLGEASPMLSMTGSTNTLTPGFLFGVADGASNLRFGGGARGPANRTYLLSASSILSPPLDIMIGVTTGAVFTVSGASILGHPVSGAELTVFGDIYAGPQPNAWTGSKAGAGNLTITASDTNAMPSIVMGHQGGANSRVELVTSNLLARLVATSSAGAIPWEVWAGSQRVARFDASLGLVVHPGLPLVVGSDSITDMTGTLLSVSGGVLNVTVGTNDVAGLTNWMGSLGDMAWVDDATSDGGYWARRNGGWDEVASAEHVHAEYFPSAATTNSPITGDLLLKKTLPSLFFSDDTSSTGAGIVFGSGGFVIGPAAYAVPDYVGAPWIEISTNGALTVLDDVLSSGDAEFSGSVSGAELIGARITIETASNTNAPAAGSAAIFLRQVAGKGQLVVRFPTGADQVIATEP